jgi:lauroyl/myristoyl acyltransferase
MPISKENKARYPKNWAEISSYVRFDRANNKCEWCGAENYRPHLITGSKVILTCAHIYDMRPEACQLDNLAALCQKCHNTHDAKHRSANKAAKQAAKEAH